LALDQNGQIKAPEAPGLGMEINLEALNSYLVDVSIEVNGKQIFFTPNL